MQPIQLTYQSLLMRLCPDRNDSEYRQILQTHALMGQILAFRTARETLLRRLGQPRLSKADIAAISTQVRNLTLHSLGAGPIKRETT
jgi:hypothetical protein